MIHVIATIEVRPGDRERFLSEFAAMKADVTAESGCIEYGATIGLDTGLPSGADYLWADPRPNAIVIVEKWATMEAWKAHLRAPHMDAYRARTKDLVTARIVHVLAPVDGDRRMKELEPAIDFIVE